MAQTRKSAKSVFPSPFKSFASGLLASSGAVSLIAIHQHGIPDHFPDEVIAEADAAKPAGLGKRRDLREMPLITIDPPDAKDFDDAISLKKDSDGNWHLGVHIADVSAFIPMDSKRSILRPLMTKIPQNRSVVYINTSPLKRRKSIA